MAHPERPPSLIHLYASQKHRVTEAKGRETGRVTQQGPRGDGAGTGLTCTANTHTNEGPETGSGQLSGCAQAGVLAARWTGLTGRHRGGNGPRAQGPLWQLSHSQQPLLQTPPRAGVVGCPWRPHPDLLIGEGEREGKRRAACCDPRYNLPPLRVKLGHGQGGQGQPAGDTGRGRWSPRPPHPPPTRAPVLFLRRMVREAV